ncbi:Hypothetical protein MVR_LOCUS63 [uncultured virus]|nr:Hypothetical protein MVR_LOCUS63 [uncultured virus]
MPSIIYPKSKTIAGLASVNPTLGARITSSLNKNELMIQFCEEDNIEGVQMLFDIYDGSTSYCSSSYDNLKVWKLCESSTTPAKQQILKLFLKRSTAVREAHTNKLCVAITDDNAKLIDTLLLPLDRNTIGCECITRLLKTAAVTSADITAMLVARWDYACSNNCSECSGTLLAVLLRSLLANNIATFESALACRSALPQAKLCEESRLKGNMDLLRNACILGNRHVISLLLNSLPFDACDSTYLPSILMTVTSSTDSEISDLIFGAFGDSLEPASIKPEYLTNACTNGLLIAARVMIARGTFNRETINNCVLICSTQGHSDIVTALLEYVVDVHVAVKGSSTTVAVQNSSTAVAAVSSNTTAVPESSASRFIKRLFGIKSA